MVKALFPLNPEAEDFADPDQKFNSLPFSDEIPEVSNRALKTPPFTYHYWAFKTCREKVVLTGITGWVLGWSLLGYGVAQARYGYCASTQLRVCEKAVCFWPCAV